uniref:Gametogenetin-binding protein 2-like n=1 Tax=Macrostomum lignano TaxID=282301 RepID=A0A1I8IYJ1_9PLAT
FFFLQHQMEHSLRICSIDVVTEANQNNFLLPRQVAVDIDDDLTVTMQLCDTRLFNLAYASSPAGQDDTGVAAFKEKFNLFTQKELADSLMGSSDDLGSAAISVIGCVGCRRAVEAFLGHLRGKTISLHSDWFASATRLHYLLEVVRRVLECRVTAGGKAKKGRRCAMHGLDAHKTGRTSWKELWDVMTTECRAELGLVSFESLEDTLDAHLVRHKFCRECRAKVERAFAMMIGDEAPDNTYKPAVFAFVRVCKERGHLHLLPDKTATDTLYELVDRAEPELLQSNPRERHAQTMDAAQEEVLTCIGLHLYNRLTHLAHTLRSDEQTWLLSLLLCLEQLRQGLESAVEKKRGYSSLDLFYWQLEREEKVAEQRREAKREKRRQKRQNKRAAVGNGATDGDGADTATDSVVTQQQQPPPRPSDHSPRSSGGSNGGGNGGAASSASSSSCSTSHNSSGFSETEECSATGGRSVGGSVRRQRTTGNQTQRQQQKPSSVESVANGAQTTQCDRQRPLSS